MAVLDSNGRKVGLIMDDGMDSSRRQMETVVGTRRVLFWADGGQEWSDGCRSEGHICKLKCS